MRDPGKADAGTSGNPYLTLSALVGAEHLPGDDV